MNKISIIHDAIIYKWDNVNLVKYKNWKKHKQSKLNIETFGVESYPFMLQVEPSSYCNLKCPYCPTGNDTMEREKRNLKLSEFKSVVDDMEKYLLFMVLWEWGEPTINPELPEMIKYASKRNIKTVTSSNAQLLTNNDLCERLLKSGLSTLIMALDSLNETKYNNFRRGGDFSKAINGIQNIVNMKKNIGSKTLLNLRMVMTKENENEVDAITRFAKETGVDKFTIKTVNPNCQSHDFVDDENVMPSNPKYRRYLYEPNSCKRIISKSPCNRVWKMTSIYSNGDVVPCCYDYNSDMKIGNILDNPLTEIWMGEEYKKLRKKIFEGNYKIPICDVCTTRFKHKGKWVREINL